MTARDEVLARIRNALGAGAGAGQPGPAGPRQPPARPHPSGYRERDDRAHDQLIRALIERLEDYGATVHRASPGDLAATVAAALASRSVRRVVLPRDLDIGAPPDGLEFVTDAGLTPADLDGFDAVITTAAVAIAETGTIVLDGSPGQGRRALSLIPDYHLCLLREDQIVGLVPEALALLDPASPLTWISGPSATSDIELDRVQGVHGPRTLEVVLLSRQDSDGTGSDRDRDVIL